MQKLELDYSVSIEFLKYLQYSYFCFYSLFLCNIRDWFFRAHRMWPVHIFVAETDKTPCKLHRANKDWLWPYNILLNPDKSQSCDLFLFIEIQRVALLLQTQRQTKSSYECYTNTSSSVRGLLRILMLLLSLLFLLRISGMVMLNQYCS